MALLIKLNDYCNIRNLSLYYLSVILKALLEGCQNYENQNPYHQQTRMVVGITSRRSVAWYRVCFGSKRSQVQILSSRPGFATCHLLLGGFYKKGASPVWI